MIIITVPEGTSPVAKEMVASTRRRITSGLRMALNIGAELIGINNRDLRDFSVDVERTERLMGEIPTGVKVVSEPGIARPEQLRKLEDAGVAAVLVGETLMRSADPEAALRTLLGFE